MLKRKNSYVPFNPAKCRHSAWVKSQQHTPIQKMRLANHSHHLQVHRIHLCNTMKKRWPVYWKTWGFLAREENNLRILKNRIVPPTSLPLLIALDVIKPFHLLNSWKSRGNQSLLWKNSLKPRCMKKKLLEKKIRQHISVQSTPQLNKILQMRPWEMKIN